MSKLLKELHTLIHVHSGYSLLDGALSIKDLVKRAKELGYKAIGLTEHGNMYSLMPFYSACKKEGIKPIFGCETYIVNDRFRKDQDRARGHHLVLLAENEIGFKNLLKLVSLGYTEGFYYNPRIDKDLLKKYSEGIIGTSACLAGEIPSLLLSDGYEVAKETALKYQEILGEGNFFLELQDHGIKEQKQTNPLLIKISRETGIPLSIANDVHYLAKEDAEVHDVLLCIQTDAKVKDENRMRLETDEFYIKSPEEMASLFPEIKDAYENTNKIGERCNVELRTDEVFLPDFEIDQEKYDSPSDLLKHYVNEGFQRKLNFFSTEKKKEAIERARYEIEVIENMGFVTYFLIVRDFIKHAKEQGIAVGPGRGSAAGSLVSYLIDITDVNPLQHGLLFERFLNPERVSMPDIDIDFEKRRRDEVIDYTIEKYGQEAVAQIAAFGTLSARSVVRDVTRVLDEQQGFTYALGDKVAKSIPMGMGLREALENSELKKLYESNGNVKKIINIALKLEGLPRHVSTHAAGVVIADGPVTDYVPVAVSKGDIITQTEKKATEKLGLLKMDFLGLRNLSVIQDALAMIKERHNKEIDIDHLPFDDEATMKIFQEGNTQGVFQFESTGMQDLLKRLHPTDIEHIIACNALYRPGPLGSGMVDDFISRRHGAKVEDIHPKLQKILAPTYGILVYQEQIMQAVQELAGFTLGEADILRRAIGKKEANVLSQQRNRFINGCIENGVSAEKAEEIFDLIEKFASYGFNKSHSAAYAYVAWQTAYLKAHYPLEFMAALLTSVAENEDKMRIYLKAAKDMGIEILPVDVNSSNRFFTIEENKIRMGMQSVKSVGESAVDSILEVRDKNGEFKSLFDFAKRTSSKVTKKVSEMLVEVGAFDKFGSRKGHLKALSKVLNAAKSARKQESKAQLALFSDRAMEDIHQIKIPDIPDDKEENLRMERKYLGYYVSGHPLDYYKDNLQGFPIRKIPQTERPVQTSGIIANVSEIITKKGDPMAFVELEDFESDITLIVFPRDYENLKKIIEIGNIVVVEGRTTIDRKEVQADDGEKEEIEIKIITTKMKILN
ncbi:MAG: DNA polymerase III subunit alpha [bacterium]